MAGNRPLPGADPYAMCYGGHQFGNWAGQLGDGRAINLGERRGADGTCWTLQLKGAGVTPYSRSADGRAVLRSSLREYLCSEAMHHLGVPTTRALCLISTGEQVVRDMLYDGHPQPEPGAIVCRVAPSFVRFGNFEILAAQGDEPLLRRLADFVITHHFPELLPASAPPNASTYVAWFADITRRTMHMVLHWMRVGFVHGVMNTDNMSVLGLTIDYGPYGWLDDYAPGWTPNTTDAGQRRYRFSEQPGIALWNLAKLGSALYPLVGEAAPLEQILEQAAGRFQQDWQRMMMHKLGLPEFHPAVDTALLQDLLALLTRAETDMTIFFRQLARQPVASALDDLQQRRRGSLQQAWYDPQQPTAEYRQLLITWLQRYAQRLVELGVGEAQRRAQMDAVNPKYVLRNYLAQQAIDQAQAGDLSTLQELQQLLRAPCDEQPQFERYYARRPDWARTRPGCSMLSCSS